MLGELLAQYFIQTETNFTKTKQKNPLVAIPRLPVNLCYFGVISCLLLKK